MTILTFYLFPLIPFIIGGFMWLRGTKIHWIEWVGSTVLGFVMAGIFHILALFGATTDYETISGHIIKSVHYPEWIEEYQEMHTRQVYCGTDSKGNAEYRTEIYYTTEHRTHHEYWECYSNINTSIGINREDHERIARVFGKITVERPHKSGFDGGDPNVYVAYNTHSGEFFPITAHKRFENKVKATPTTFSFPKVPANIKVFNYPENCNPFASDRLLGSASLISLLDFDRMNARIGPKKKVNIIMIGFGDKDSMMAQWQEAAYIGGKKNDVVIVFGGSNRKPSWVRAFGWTDSKTCLRNLESIVLENGAMTETLPLIEKEIIRGYKLKDWDKAFSHISVPPPTWAIWTYFIIATIAQLALWFWAHNNDLDKRGRTYYYLGY